VAALAVAVVASSPGPAGAYVSRASSDCFAAHAVASDGYASNGRREWASRKKNKSRPMAPKRAVTVRHVTSIGNEAGSAFNSTKAQDSIRSCRTAWACRAAEPTPQAGCAPLSSWSISAHLDRHLGRAISARKKKKKTPTGAGTSSARSGGTNRNGSGQSSRKNPRSPLGGQAGSEQHRDRRLDGPTKSKALALGATNSGDGVRTPSTAGTQRLERAQPARPNAAHGLSRALRR